MAKDERINELDFLLFCDCGEVAQFILDEDWAICGDCVYLFPQNHAMNRIRYDPSLIESYYDDRTLIEN